MPQVTLNFPDNSTNTTFSSGKPSYSQLEYDRNLKFANRKLVLNMGGIDHGIATFTLYLSGNIDYGSVCFYDANGSVVSVSETRDGLYKPNFPPDYFLENIFKEEGSNSTYKRFFVCVNGDPGQKTETLNVEISVASKNPTNAKVTLQFECPGDIPLYEYETGLHTYSPYDAIESNSTLKTKLYSITPISDWTTNTVVYQSGDLAFPAMNYFYGYEDNVYQIGSELDRSYGTKTRIKAVKKRFSTRFNSSTETIGPKNFYNSTDETSEACVEPIYEGLGKVSKIFSNASLDQPQQYRYYMGYDSTVKRESNDSVFTQYNFNDEKHYPITGFQHATQKLVTHLLSGWDKTLQQAINLSVLALGIGGLAALLSTSAVVANASLSVSIFLNSLVGPFSSTLVSVGSTIGAFLGPVLAALPYLALLALIAWAIFHYFSRKTKYYEEDCKEFLHHFSNTPYLNTGTTLYRDEDLSVVNNGYYCDGAYYYFQSAGNITDKELSYTEALVNNDPKTIKYLESVKPDDPTLVMDRAKLLFLPYTSGKPMPYCGGDIVYYSAFRSHTITPTCCDFETCPPVNIDVPYGKFTSCLSQADADTKASRYHSTAIAFAQIRGNYIESTENAEANSVDFTHEIKVETNPNTTDIWWVGNLELGNKLYYDGFGCTKALDGYYTTGSSSYYKIFYHTTNGTIDDIQYITTSGSTTTDSGIPLVMENDEFTSNWFISGSNPTRMDNYVKENWLERTYDPNSIYNNGRYGVEKGYIISGSYNDFQVFPNFTDISSVSEAESGYYKPLIDWLDEDPFYYQKSGITMSLHPTEICYNNQYSTFRGFEIQSTLSGSEVLSPVENSLTIDYTVYYSSSFINTDSEYIIPYPPETTTVNNVFANTGITTSTGFKAVGKYNGKIWVTELDNNGITLNIYSTNDFSNPNAWQSTSVSLLGLTNVFNRFKGQDNLLYIINPGKVFKSTDYGASFTNDSFFNFKFIFDIQFNGDNVLAVRGDGEYYYSTNRGTSYSTYNFTNSSGTGNSSDDYHSAAYVNGKWFAGNVSSKKLLSNSDPSDDTSWNVESTYSGFYSIPTWISQIGSYIFVGLSNSSDINATVGTVIKYLVSANGDVTFVSNYNWPNKVNFYVGKSTQEIITTNADSNVDYIYVSRDIGETFETASFTNNQLAGDTFDGQTIIYPLYDNVSKSYYLANGGLAVADNLLRISGSVVENISESSYTGSVILNPADSINVVVHDSQITNETIISDIELDIVSSNPVNNILYVTSSFQGCGENIDNPISCSTEFNGFTELASSSFPRTQIVELGTRTGNIDFKFTSSITPVKAVVEWNNNEVINLGYIGGTSYQSELNSILTNKGISTELIKSTRTTGSIFDKSTSSPSFALVKFYAPITDANWEYELSCPPIIYIFQVDPILSTNTYKIDSSDELRTIQITNPFNNRFAINISGSMLIASSETPTILQGSSTAITNENILRPNNDTGIIPSTSTVLTSLTSLEHGNNLYDLYNQVGSFSNNTNANVVHHSTLTWYNEGNHMLTSNLISKSDFEDYGTIFDVKSGYYTILRNGSTLTYILVHDGIIYEFNQITLSPTAPSRLSTLKSHRLDTTTQISGGTGIPYAGTYSEGDEYLLGMYSRKDDTFRIAKFVVNTSLYSNSNPTEFASYYAPEVLWSTSGNLQVNFIEAGIFYNAGNINPAEYGDYAFNTPQNSQYGYSPSQDPFTLSSTIIDSISSGASNNTNFTLHAEANPPIAVQSGGISVFAIDKDKLPRFNSLVSVINEDDYKYWVQIKNGYMGLNSSYIYPVSNYLNQGLSDVSSNFYFAISINNAGSFTNTIVVNPGDSFTLYFRHINGFNKNTGITKYIPYTVYGAYQTEFNGLDIKGSIEAPSISYSNDAIPKSITIPNDIDLSGGDREIIVSLDDYPSVYATITVTP